MLIGTGYLLINPDLLKADELSNFFKTVSANYFSSTKKRLFSITNPKLNLKYVFYINIRYIFFISVKDYKNLKICDINIIIEKVEIWIKLLMKLLQLK